MYARPNDPDVRDPLYEEGFNDAFGDGYSSGAYHADKGSNYRWGYKVGLEAKDFHREEMDKSGSSNA